MARLPPGVRLCIRLGNSVPWCGTHCSTAFARMTSKSEPRQLARSARSNDTPGMRFRAASTMSAELSMPWTVAPGKRSARTSVELPGPQPRSMVRRTFSAVTAFRRSRTGRVRCFSMVVYCVADQDIGSTRLLVLGAGLGQRQRYILDAALPLDQHQDEFTVGLACGAAGRQRVSRPGSAAPP